MTKRIESTVLDKVFEEFLRRLTADKDVKASVVERLRQDVIEQRSLKVETIKAALFTEDELT